MVPAFAVWMTGLPASGKSTIARELAAQLKARGVDTAVLESDALRAIVTPRPTYTDEERDTFYATLAHIGTLLVRHGVPVIFDATANRRAHRGAARAEIERSIEAYVDSALEVCVARDPKGTYRKAAGQASVPGLQVAYERRKHPDVFVSGGGDATEAARTILRTLESRTYVNRQPLSAAP